MKTIYIVRHAKSSWGDFSISDHERTLTQVGVNKTKKVIDFFNKNNVKPSVIICSSAIRAVETAKLIAQGINYDVNQIITNASLYHADVNDIYNELFGVDNKLNSAMIIAHNPTLTDFANEFAVPVIDNLPTTGVICVEFETDNWHEITNAKYKVKFVVFPRMLS